MDSFYLIVLGVATVALILMLAFLGWTISQTKKGGNYPKIIKTCPDNWTINSTIVPGKVVCKRPDTGYANRGTGENLTGYMTTATNPGHVAGNTNYLNFADEKWTPCGKRDWAQKYNIRWDSVESANYCN